MKLTTKGRYAVTAMLDLAVHNGKGPIALADISERQGISLSYLEQLFAKLRKTGLVASTRGPGGGYRLNRNPGDVFIADVVTAVDEPFDATRCGGAKDCNGEKRCLTHDLWEELSQQIRGFLSEVSLADVIDRHHLRTKSHEQNVKAAQHRSEAGVVEASV
ncbi:MAG: Rrf2 family transcriptional regulator [Gammaproteobacteria bacterium]|nr:Rrf2 family transcriptional regulator [Gammaproteobacteria bacterium]